MEKNLLIIGILIAACAIQPAYAGRDKKCPRSWKLVDKNTPPEATEPNNAQPTQQEQVSAVPEQTAATLKQEPAPSSSTTPKTQLTTYNSWSSPFWNGSKREQAFKLFETLKSDECYGTGKPELDSIFLSQVITSLTKYKETNRLIRFLILCDTHIEQGTDLANIAPTALEAACTYFVEQGTQTVQEFIKSNDADGLQEYLELCDSHQQHGARLDAATTQAAREFLQTRRHDETNKMLEDLAKVELLHQQLVKEKRAAIQTLRAASAVTYHFGDAQDAESDEENFTAEDKWLSHIHRGPLQLVAEPEKK